MERDRAIVLKTQQRGVCKTVEPLIYIYVLDMGLKSMRREFVKQEYDRLREDYKYLELQYVIV